MRKRAQGRRSPSAFSFDSLCIYCLEYARPEYAEQQNQGIRLRLESTIQTRAIRRDFGVRQIASMLNDPCGQNVMKTHMPIALRTMSRQCSEHSYCFSDPKFVVMTAYDQ